jgi:hypothetical protein
VLLLLSLLPSASAVLLPASLPLLLLLLLLLLGAAALSTAVAHVKPCRWVVPPMLPSSPAGQQDSSRCVSWFIGEAAPLVPVI